MTAKILILIFFLGTTLFTFLNPADAAGTGPLTIQEVRAIGYFDGLEYDNDQERDAMPELEAKLIDAAEMALLLPETDSYFKENSLIFVYAALLMDNIIDAYNHGRMPLSIMTKIKAFSSTGNEAEELALRKTKILQYVEQAKKLLPDDVRMDSWLIGMKVKHLDPSYAQILIDMAEEREDTFSLISAITVTKDLKLTDEQEDVLAALVNRFTSLRSPCLFGKKRSQCRSTPLAPFAAQSGVVMLADYRLKMAEKETSPRKQKMGRTFARMLYKSTHMVWMKDSTPGWVNQSIIEERMAKTEMNSFKLIKSENFWKSRNAQVVFKCTSCHASPLVSRPIDVF